MNLEYDKDRRTDLGLKILSRSDSYNRCAAAVAALIRISDLDKGHVMGSFFLAAVAQAEPITHLEGLANSLQDFHPEKKYYTLLSGLAQATVILNVQSQPSLELAQLLRRRFFSVLELCRCVVSLYLLWNRFSKLNFSQI